MSGRLLHRLLEQEEKKTMIVSDLFKIHHSKSKGFESYDSGEVPFVSNGLMNNGVIGFVSPLESDRVFDFRGICVSAFCEATVQEPPFLPRGNGGSGLMVLEPIAEMNKEELFYYASYINESFKWRFSFGRMVKKDRFKGLPIEPYGQEKSLISVQKLLPKGQVSATKIKHNRNFLIFNIEDLFNMRRGDFHALDKLDPGKYPTVSRVAFNNGIVGYFDPPERAKVYPKYFITVSTVSGDAFVQLEDFIATDNVIVCKPKLNLKITTLFFIQVMLNNVKWRYSYGRQCYKTKFAKTGIPLPVTKARSLDEDYMESVIKNTTYWPIVKGGLEESPKVFKQMSLPNIG